MRERRWRTAVHYPGGRRVRGRAGLAGSGIRPARILAAASCVACACLALLSCSRQSAAVSADRQSLFTLGYGPGERQIDLSASRAGPPQAVSLVMRNGLIHIADGPGGRIMRLSSFGDLLAMLYDPARTAAPFLLAEADASGQPPAGTQALRTDPVPDPQPRAPDAEPAGASPVLPGKSDVAVARSAGRYAVAYPFRALGRIAVDSRQTIHAEDRLPEGQRVYDAASEAWCDRVILRFGKGGEALPPLGQEGPGGTPFPAILDLAALPEDDIAVTTVSPAMFAAYRFSPDGALRFVLRIPRDSLPVPGSLASRIAGSGSGSRLVASLDGIIPEGLLSDAGIALKIDYRIEKTDAVTGAVLGLDFAGSWIFFLDASTGSIRKSFQVAAPEEADRIPRLLGMVRDTLFLMSPSEGDAYEVRLVSRGGPTLKRFTIRFPEGGSGLLSLHLSPEGVLCALWAGESGAEAVWWRFDRYLSPSGSAVRRAAGTGEK